MYIVHFVPDWANLSDRLEQRGLIARLYCDIPSTVHSISAVPCHTLPYLFEKNSTITTKGGGKNRKLQHCRILNCYSHI